MTDRAEPSSDQPHLMKPGGAWAMAVGGMIGGGIFSTLGVVIAVAGQFAWASFVLGGLVALCSGQSYAALSRVIDRPGGSYAYLMDIGWRRTARIAVWVLVVGYTFTVSVYAVTFGSYAAFALGAAAWVKTAAAIGAIAVLAGINLMGAAEATFIEKVAVWGKLAILLVLSGFGLARWDTGQLVADPGSPVGWTGALIGMGVVFMAYEGFQLLSYDYDEMEDPPRTISRAMPAAILATMATYVLVALGAAMLAGAGEIVAREEVALAIAGREALGLAGFLAVSLAATFSAGSAINATVFATARLASRAAEDGEMPALFGKRDSSGVPWAGTLLISGAAAVLVVIGGLEVLVEVASLIFLAVFALVNWLAIHCRVGRRWASWIGLCGSLGGAAMLVLYLAGVV
ncbi:APC family permease [Erythrobacter sp.]|uniref:APC family permease n=1 Tax=Erythrobacter sp. TaxID=1042 RepID=UPI001425D402|nr:APC family permease [Erythrobacter sp.]QIQ85869.1 MAG: amino acid permease [Erythrobacter sp.]